MLLDLIRLDDIALYAPPEVMRACYALIKERYGIYAGSSYQASLMDYI